MDNMRLFEAARTGNVEVLLQLLQVNPLILTDVALTSPVETLLHVAAKAGQINFVREIMKHKPELARELNKDGLRPMDTASVIGNVEIVRELLKIDHEICRLKGKERRTALHYASINGRVEVIHELFSTCSESIKDVTVYGETALHLAVKNNQFEAFSILVKWLETLSVRYGHVVNWGDCNGNTVLHLATSRKQLEIVELLVGENSAFKGILEVDATNSKGLTAMDVLDMVIENPKDVQLREFLRRAGALGAQDAILSASSLQKVSKNNQTQNELDWFKYFKFQVQRDSPSDTRNALLVVAALIASVTFQAGVNPPTGLLDLNNESSSNNTKTSSGNTPKFGPATTSVLAVASAILGTQATSYLFLFGNTLSFTASLSIIIYLTGGFPFQRELLISIFSMMFTYGCSIDSITPKAGITYLLLGIAFILPFLLQWLPMWAKKAWKGWRRPTASQTLLVIGS